MSQAERFLVGIDFSKHRADLAILNQAGELLVRHRGFDNSQVGYQQAKQLLLETLREQPVGSIDVGGEATSYYWLPMFIQLSQDADLSAYPLNLFLLNARWVRWFKKSQAPNHKDDIVDPQAIGDYIRFRRPRHAWQFDPHWLSLRFSTRMRFHLVKAQTREKNLFHLFLFLAYSTYARRRPFSHPLVKVSQRLLNDPQRLDRWRQLSREEIAAELDELSDHRLEEPLEQAARLRTLLAESFPVPAELEAPLQRNLTLLLENIDFLSRQIAQVNQWIEAQVRSGAYPEVGWLDSIPGVGLVLASGIAAEIAGLERFAQVEVADRRRPGKRMRTSREVVDAIGKYAGLWWPKNASGQFQAEERRLSREGNAYLRYYILQAAERMRPRIPSFQAYYQKKYDQATKHKHKRAMVLTGCKALDLFVALLRHQRPYQAKEGDRPLT